MSSDRAPSDAPVPNAPNLAFVEDLYYAWLEDPGSVDEAWRSYFERLPREPGVARAPEGFRARRPDGSAAGGERGSAPAPAVAADAEAAFQARVDRLVQAYRDYGHLRADLDPLKLVRPAEKLSLESFGLTKADLGRVCKDPDGQGERTLADLVSRLEETYCRTLGVELAHMHDADLRAWMQRQMERTRNRISLEPEVKRLLLRKILEAQTLERFVGTKFLGAKRFSVEGAEALLPLLELLVDRAVGHGVRNVVLGMAHRGRINVLANVLGKPLAEIFAEFRDAAIVNAPGGDVKYHLGYSSDRETPDGVLVHLSLSFNPSHLEWIDTVVQGRVRAKQDRYHDPERVRSVPLLIHGDAAFTGQGIVAESLQMSELDAYRVGGTIHVIVDNQIGFTTGPRDARSTTYPTGPARMLQIPLIHVNGEDVEAVAQAVLLAVDFRQRFHRDVVIDLWTYRRHGHNEGDEPAFTQPVMYRTIAAKPTLADVYAEQLVREGVVGAGDVRQIEEAYRARLGRAYEESGRIQVSVGSEPAAGFWKGYRGGSIPRGEPETAVPEDELRRMAEALSHLPRGFEVHPKLARVLQARDRMLRGERPLDWGAGEAAAYATLAWEGTRVRLVGQDTRRGTFSHRHAVLHDHRSGVPYAPLAHLRDGQGTVEVRDSLLSEAGALGFEYGYSLEMPDALVVWEAQFGDFVNAAQVVVDQFLSSGEAKWNRLSGLVLLLPHGMEGQGPEHSSARLERFLELSVEDNWRVVNLTTPAQLFHALRRQIRSPWRKPLVVMSPKSLLRLPQAVSPLSELARGRFRPVLGDGTADPADVTRIVLCSGKLYYDLAAARHAQSARHAAIVRLEQLYPMALDELLAEIRRYRAGAEIVWAQEEPSNMGAWGYVDLRVAPRLPSPVQLVSRAPAASPAVGSATRHKLEQEQLVREALGAPAVHFEAGARAPAAQEH